MSPRHSVGKTFTNLFDVTVSLNCCACCPGIKSFSGMKYLQNKPLVSSAVLGGVVAWIYRRRGKGGWELSCSLCRL